MPASVRACNRGTLLDDVQEDIDSESDAFCSDRSNDAVQSFKTRKKTSSRGLFKATAETKMEELQ